MSKADLDKHFPRNGPCMFHPTRYARHRLIDAMRDRHRAGESIAAIRDDYGRRYSIAAVRAAVNASPDDNRMTPKEIREGRAEWEAVFRTGEETNGVG